MDCILNHCHEQLSKDFLVVGFYGAAVACMIALAFIAKSRSLQTAAMLISAAWVFSLISFFYIDGPSYYVLAIMVDALLAYQFWRLARVEIFPAMLCVIMLGEIVFLAAAIAISLDTYWTIFVLNRIFEMTLLYIIGCSLFRLQILRTQDKKQKPPQWWKARFITS